MLCPFVEKKDTSVVDSRPTEDGTAIKKKKTMWLRQKGKVHDFWKSPVSELTVIKKWQKRTVW